MDTGLQDGPIVHWHGPPQTDCTSVWLPGYTALCDPNGLNQNDRPFATFHTMYQ